MKYNRIANKAIMNTNTALKESERDIDKIKQNNQRIEELSGLIALTTLREKNFKTFQDRYQKLINNPTLAGIASREDLPSAREVYTFNKTIPISDNMTMKFEELEQVLMLDSIQDPDLRESIRKITNPKKQGG